MDLSRIRLVNPLSAAPKAARAAIKNCNKVSIEKMVADLVGVERELASPLDSTLFGKFHVSGAILSLNEFSRRGKHVVMTDAAFCLSMNTRIRRPKVPETPYFVQFPERYGELVRRYLAIPLEDRVIGYMSWGVGRVSLYLVLVARGDQFYHLTWARGLVLGGDNPFDSILRLCPEMAQPNKYVDFVSAIIAVSSQISDVCVRTDSHVRKSKTSKGPVYLIGEDLDEDFNWKLPDPFNPEGIPLEWVSGKLIGDRWIFPKYLFEEQQKRAARLHARLGTRYGRRDGRDLDSGNGPVDVNPDRHQQGAEGGDHSTPEGDQGDPWDRSGD